MDSYPYYMASLYCYIFILGPPPDKDNPYAPIDIKEIHKKNMQLALYIRENSTFL